MPLSEDQRALLRLLLAGDGYAQIAEVLGTSTNDVRTRAHRAVTEMGGETLDGRSEDDVRARLRELDGAPEPRSGPAGLARGRRNVPRPLWLVLAGGLVGLVAVLVITQLGRDADEEPQTAAPDQEDAVSIELTPVGGSQARGTAAIVRVADLPAVDLDARGLAPTDPDETYVLWLLGAGDRGLPIAFRRVGDDGRFTGRTEIPSSAAGLLPSLDRVDLSRVRSREAAAVLNEAAQGGTLPQHIGTTVLRGALPG
jgi:hypothetical protein